MRVRWHLSWRAAPRARAIADRHYNRQKIGAPQFVAPGRCIVLLTEPADAFWVTSWPFGEYVKHRWPGAWICSAFRNENREAYLSSEIIVEALSVTRWKYGTPPDLGMVTFIDRDKTKPKRDPGRCFRKAGFVDDGDTEGGLVALRMTAATLACIPSLEPANYQEQLGLMGVA